MLYKNGGFLNHINQIKFISFDPFLEGSLVERYWKALLQKSDQHYFLSWGWISTWIKSLEGKVDVRFIVGFHHDEPVLSFFIGVVTKKKFGIFPYRTLSLNSTGSSYFDALYLEYNGILKDPSVQFSIEDLILTVKNMSWNEFLLPGLAYSFVKETNVLTNSEKRSIWVLVDEESPACYVDLEQVRSNDLDYLRLISSNKRSQIRRSIKEYEKNGKIEVIEAQNVQQAHELFSEMVILHQKEWESRGRAGAFSNEYLLQFHKDLISSRFDSGEIQILKIFNSSMVIGVLYSFILNGRVYFYQSGLNYLPGNIYRPGMVSHYFSILHNAKNGRIYYDFLAGDAAYKISLATDSQPVYWLRLFRNPLKYYFELGIRRVKSSLKSKPVIAIWLRKMKDLLRRTTPPPESDSGLE